MTGTLLVRADSTAAIGSGHVMRCLALAQGWQDAGGNVTFAAASLGDTLHRRLVDEGVVVHRLLRLQQYRNSQRVQVGRQRDDLGCFGVNDTACSVLRSVNSVDVPPWTTGSGAKVKRAHANGNQPHHPSERNNKIHHPTPRFWLVTGCADLDSITKTPVDIRHSWRLFLSGYPETRLPGDRSALLGRG